MTVVTRKYHHPHRKKFEKSEENDEISLWEVIFAADFLLFNNQIRLNGSLSQNLAQQTSKDRF